MLSNKILKFSEVVTYIYKNIDKSLTLKHLSNIAHMSIASLKRLFEDSIGMSPGAFIRRVRMELAIQLLSVTDNSILETALSVGFNDESAFARRFKKLFGYSPKNARKKIDIISELEHVELQEPEFIILKSTLIQAVTIKGLYYQSAPNAWHQLKKLLEESELTDDFTGIFIGIGHDNPHYGNIKAEDVRFSAGVAYLERHLGKKDIKIVGGPYVRFHYYGKANNLGMAYHYIYGAWNIENNNCIDMDTPAFTCFDTIPHSHKEQSILINVPLNKNAN